jgi:hypothetical protein
MVALLILARYEAGRGAESSGADAMVAGAPGVGRLLSER